jgi:hypothetical protein
VIERIAPIITGVPDGFAAAPAVPLKSATNNAQQARERNERIDKNPLAYRKKVRTYGF